MKKNHWCSIFLLVVLRLRTGDSEALTVDNERKVTCNKKIDLGITLDASASVGEETYKKSKQFAKELLSRFKISPSSTHVALSYISMYHHIVATFNKSHTLEQAKTIIDDMVYEKSISRLSIAILEMHFAVFAGKYSGIRPKHTGSKMAFVFMTDGFSSTGFDMTNFRAQQMQSYGVEMFVVHQKGKVQEKILRAIASKPIRRHLFVFEDEKAKRRRIIDKIVEQICYGVKDKK